MQKKRQATTCFNCGSFSFFFRHKKNKLRKRIIGKGFKTTQGRGESKSKEKPSSDNKKWIFSFHAILDNLRVVYHQMIASVLGSLLLINTNDNNCKNCASKWGY